MPKMTTAPARETTTMDDSTRHHRSVLKQTLRVVLPLGILFCGIGGFVALGTRPPIDPRPEQGENVPRVETAEVVRHEGTLDLNIDGLVVPSHEITLAAEVAGRIVHKNPVCRAGKYLSKGTLLIEIDPRDYDLEVRRLEKELDQATVDLKELDVEEKNTQRLIELARETAELQHNELERLEKLSEMQKSYVTQSQLDQERRNDLVARNALLTLENQLRSIATRRNRLEAAIELVTVRREDAELDRQRTKITMPVDGMIVEDLVEQDSFVAPGTPVAIVEDTSKVEVRCSLQMDELYWLWSQRDEHQTPSDDPSADYQIPETPVTVVYRLAGERFAWDGVVSRYEGIGLDEATRTVPCRVVVANPRAVRRLGPAEGDASPTGAAAPPALVRGMFVTVVIHAQPKSELLTIPERAVRPGNKVWRVRRGRLDVVGIHLVHIIQDIAVVRPAGDDLHSGDRVVVTPLALVENGMAVQEQHEP